LGTPRRELECPGAAAVGAMHGQGQRFRHRQVVNLRIMEKMKSQSVDLIDLDPPFNSQQTYNMLYRTLTGRPVPEQAEAFFDTCFVCRGIDVCTVSIDVSSV
jgi:hypothetical protein